MTMAETLEDAGTIEHSRFGQAVAKSFGASFGVCATYIALVRFLRTFGKRCYSILFDINHKIMRQLNRQSTFGEKTKYIMAVHTENA